MTNNPNWETQQSSSSLWSVETLASRRGTGGGGKGGGAPHRGSSLHSGSPVIDLQGPVPYVLDRS